MKFSLISATFAALTLATPAYSSILVTSPANGSTVGTSVPYVASGSTSTCGKGVSAMGVYVDNVLFYQVSGSSLNTTLSLSAGAHRTVIEEWDYCGGATTSVVSVSVIAASAVAVATPLDGSSVTSPTTFTGTATTTCGAGVANIQIFVDGALDFTIAGATFNTPLTLTTGNHAVLVTETDNCGGTSSKSLALVVTTGTKLSNLQSAPNWNQWGELPPVYAICTSCSGISWLMTQNESAISLSGNATEFTIGGTKAYADVLWSNKLIGQGTTLGIPDLNHTILPNISYLVYDTDVYVTNWPVTQNLEFDVNLYMNGFGMEWGTECNHLADGFWDIWNNVSGHWVATNVPCSLNNGAWNHVNFKAQRLANNNLVYQTITVNGVAYNLNITVAPFTVPSGWYGLTANFQMDGNYKMATNTTYLDNLSVTYF